MGVWIEIALMEDVTVPVLSLPVWECGLKYVSYQKENLEGSHSLYGSVD